jgi:CRP/FNR family transcriptional regulator, cyclic AMP receptor protein
MDSHDLERDDILSACRAAETLRLKPGEFLFREGDEARCLYVVKSGTLRVMSGSTVYETVRAGGIVGEMAILEAEMPRSANVIAGTHAELAAIDLDKFLELVSNTPSFALTVMRVIARRLRIMNQRYRIGHGA